MGRLIDILDSYGINTINESRRYKDIEEYIKETVRGFPAQSKTLLKIISWILNKELGWSAFNLSIFSWLVIN